jgi:hypothetical protein
MKKVFSLVLALTLAASLLLTGGCAKINGKRVLIRRADGLYLVVMEESVKLLMMD